MGCLAASVRDYMTLDRRGLSSSPVMGAEITSINQSINKNFSILQKRNSPLYEHQYNNQHQQRSSTDDKIFSIS